MRKKMINGKLDTRVEGGDLRWRDVAREVAGNYAQTLDRSVRKVYSERKNIAKSIKNVGKGLIFCLLAPYNFPTTYRKIEEKTKSMGGYQYNWVGEGEDPEVNIYNINAWAGAGYPISINYLITALSLIAPFPNPEFPPELQDFAAVNAIILLATNSASKVYEDVKTAKIRLKEKRK